MDIPPPWIRYLPARLRERVEHRPNLLRIMSNIGWLISENALRLVTGLLVGIWIARYLGPAQFGQYSFALAFLLLFAPIASLGLQNVVVRDIVNNRSEAGEILGSSLVLIILGSLIAFLALVGTITYLRAGDALTISMVIILGVTIFFKISATVRYWFESQMLSKYSVWAENGAVLIVALIKIGLLLSKAPLIAFVWAIFAEALLASLALFAVYHWRGGSFNGWRPRFARAKNLFSNSWPLLLSGIAVIVYMRIDQIMLGQMVGERSVGIYSAAVRISEIWYFIPMAIVASVYPALISAKQRSEALYYDRLQKLYDLVVLLAVLVAIPITFTSDWIVTLLFGNAYTEAGSVLIVHVWCSLFVFLGAVSGKWIVVENLQLLSFQRAFAGVIVNIGLNLILIPRFGVVGAAVATLISQASAALFFDLVNKQTRRMFAMKIRSLNLLRTVHELKLPGNWLAT